MKMKKKSQKLLRSSGAGKNKINFILNIIYKLFFVVVIVIVVLLVISKLNLPGDFQVLIVRSGSMEPAIQTGSIVVVKPKVEYQVGDVITFSGRGHAIPTTHRIVEVKEGSSASLGQGNGQKIFVTKGDANNSIDLNETQERNVIGRVLFSIPYIGYAIATAQKPVGFMFLIAIPALLIIYDEIVKIFRETRKMFSKKREKEVSTRSSSDTADESLTHDLEANKNKHEKDKLQN